VADEAGQGTADPVVVGDADGAVAAGADEAVAVGADKAVARDADEALAGESVSSLVEQVARDGGMLAYRGAEVVGARRLPELRRVARDIAGVVCLVVVLLTAFALGNWAAGSALSAPLPGWRAPLVLAAAWIAVALVLAVLLVYAERGPARKLRQAVVASSAETLAERQRALEQAQQKLRESLDELAEGVSRAAEQRIAATILPLAGGMVDAGEGMIEAADEVIEAADEITDVLEEKLPGGVIVNRAFDLALVPGRVGVRFARTVLRVGQTGT
jgi:hypothetical protein